MRLIVPMLMVIAALPAVIGCSTATTPLRCGATDSDSSDDQGLSAIAVAAFKGDLEGVEEALAADASLEDQSFGARMTPLAVAASQGHADLVRWLVKRGALVNITDHTGTTPLMFAAKSGSEATIQALLDAGAYVNAQNVDGSSPLHYAAVGGHLAAVDRLLKAGADPTLADADGELPAEEATSRGFSDIALRLQTAERTAERARRHPP